MRIQILTILTVLLILILGIIVYDIFTHINFNSTIHKRQPPLPYIIYGYTKYDSGKAPNATVKVTNKNTGDYGYTQSNDTGYYQFNLANLPNGYTQGDTINITANTTTYIGYNQTTVTGSGGKLVNVTLNIFIPNFSELVIPVTGLVIIFALISTRNNFKYEKDNKLK